MYSFSITGLCFRLRISFPAFLFCWNVTSFSSASCSVPLSPSIIHSWRKSPETLGNVAGFHDIYHFCRRRSRFIVSPFLACRCIVIILKFGTNAGLAVSNLFRPVWLTARIQYLDYSFPIRKYVPIKSSRKVSMVETLFDCIGTDGCSVFRFKSLSRIRLPIFFHIVSWELRRVFLRFISRLHPQSRMVERVILWIRFHLVDAS